MTPAWIELEAPDVEAALAFYSGATGWTLERARQGGYPMLVDGRQRTAGVVPAEAGPARWVPYFLVPDVEGVAGEAMRLGATLTHPAREHEGIGRSARLLDPWGAPFRLYLSHRGAGWPGGLAALDLLSPEPAGALSWWERLSASPWRSSVRRATVAGWAPHLRVDAHPVTGALSTDPQGARFHLAPRSHDTERRMPAG